MRTSSLPAMVLLLPATLLAGGIAMLALAAPEMALLAMPLLVIAMLALLMFEIPMAMVAVLVAVYGLALDVQIDALADVGGGTAGLLGSAVVKVFPFLLTSLLCLRYGFSSSINWPFLAFVAVAAVSLVVLPMGRISTNGEMVRSFVGSTAPFVLGFARAPRNLWSALAKSVTLMPLVSAGVALLLTPTGILSAFDQNMRFQGMHSPPFLAGFAVTAIFACTLEYLRNWKTRWLVLGSLNMAILLATQARTPFAVVMMFLLIVVLAARGRVFPLKRKVDLAMGGMLPALVLLGPVMVFAADRILGGGGDPSGAGEFNFSGRDVIWPYFIDAIEARPLLGYGLGAGKLLVDPEDPAIRLIRSNAAHNEYLRLAVDAGILGCALIFVSIIAWIWSGTARSAPQEKAVLRAALLPVLLFCATDNTLIAGMGVATFIWFTAAMARSRLELQEQRGRQGGGAPQWRGVQRRALPRGA